MIASQNTTMLNQSCNQKYPLKLEVILVQ